MSISIELNDKDLLSLIVQVTGAEADNAAAKYTLSTFKQLKAYANFEQGDEPDNTEKLDTAAPIPGLPSLSANVSPSRVGLNLSYTINLNLPATTDPAVFNAIFRSLREHLLSHGE